MDNTIENLEIRVTTSGDAAANAFGRLASSAERLKGASRGAAQAVGGLADNVKETATVSKQAGRDAGEASKNVRHLGKNAKDAGESAKKGASGLSVFWQSLKRIAFYRFIRTIMKEIASAFKEGITNLYHWSSAIDGHFAKSMDRLATSTLYLKNSLGAMVSPLIESFVPVLDVIIDKVVSVLNFFNMLVSAVSGADTYTVAKKAAAVWDDSADKTKKSAKSTADELKRTILGFDEINKLIKPNSSSGGSGSTSGKTTPDYGAMFEERPLTGIFKKISDVTSGWPDWLKWLLGVGTAVGIGAGIMQLPKLLSRLYNGLKRLVALDIPRWLGNLFGGHGGGAGGSGDYDVNVDLTKGNWEVMDELKNATALVPVGLQHWGWDNIQEWIGNAATVLIGLRHWGWTTIQDWIGGAVTIAIGLKHWGWTNIEDWIGRAVTVSVGLKHWGWGTLIDWIGSAVTVSVALRKWGWESIEKWMKIDNGVYVRVGLLHWGWKNIKDWIGTAVTVAIALSKWDWTTLGNWTKADDGLYVRIGLLHWGWTTIENYIGTAITVSVGLRRWAWSTIENFIGTRITVDVGLRKSGWYWISDWIGQWTDVYVYLRRGNFYSLGDWLGSSVTVTVNLKMGSGGNINVSGGSSSSSSFGGASGGGGGTKGGGTGRQRHALGGVFSNGVWSNIPQYAGGTSNAHGTLFLAGEAGPEIVGHVGGRTEILNRSQLASTMYSSVMAAMAPAVSAIYSAMNRNVVSAYSDNDYSSFIDTVIQGLADTMNQQIDLLRQQNQYLLEIIEKPFTAEVTASSVQRALNRSNVRAGVTTVPVGQ